jgi:hypothetical protein
MMNTIAIDGVEIVEPAVDLMSAVKKKNPLLMFKPNEKRGWNEWDKGDCKSYSAQFDVFHVDNPVQKIGNIGVEQDRAGVKYYVRSRLIQNNRFSPYSSTEHQSKKSIHINNIVKEAVKYLKPVSLEEIYTEGEKRFKDKLLYRRTSMQDAINGKINYVGRAALFTEVMNMIAKGYAPITTDVQKAKEFLENNAEKIKEVNAYNPDFAFVRVLPNSVEYKLKSNSEIVRVNTKEELPEAIRGKMFVLDVSDKDTFIEDVGSKGAGTYWVIL